MAHASRYSFLVLLLCDFYLLLKYLGFGLGLFAFGIHSIEAAASCATMAQNAAFQLKDYYIHIYCIYIARQREKERGADRAGVLCPE